MTVLLSAFTAAALLTWWLSSGRSPLTILDHPNERSLHEHPIPRSGGIAILTAVVVGWGLLLAGHSMPRDLIWIMLSSGIVAAVSLLDDLLGLSAPTRLLVHLLAAGMLLVGGLGLSWGWVGMVPSLFGIVWMLNLFNFMDGMDGFASGMAVAGFGFLGLAGWLAGSEQYAWICWMISASALGFLLFNFPPARIFMGDVGSATLGLLAAALSLWGIKLQLFPAWLPILVFSVFIVDATVTLIRRALQRERIWQAHRNHYYQRLVGTGWSHRRTVLAEYVLMGTTGLSAVILLRLPQEAQAIGLVGWTCAYVFLAWVVDQHCKYQSIRR